MGVLIDTRALQLSTCSREIHRIADQTHGSAKVTWECCKCSWIVEMFEQSCDLEHKRKLQKCAKLHSAQVQLWSYQFV